ncbi:MAG: hypothetical protein Q7V63_06935 [Gammaproteobacteria bacterium]|nr:hypothetical protein [Gammaproteobacteria bacterium]
MNISLKVIAELGFADNKALLIEMPADMLSGLKIAADGTVDTKCLLGMLMMIEQEAAFEAQQQRPLYSEFDLLLNIYDSRRAVDFNHKTAS